MPETLAWYALQTRYRCEKKVDQQLQAKGLETFLPLLREVHRWSDRKQSISVPLFSGYSFVHASLTANTRASLLRTAGVSALVSFGGEAVAIPAKQIQDLQKLLAQHAIPCALHPFLSSGMRVRVRGGCLNGLEGILTEHGGRKLVIAVECIERAVAVQIEGYELELI